MKTLAIDDQKLVLIPLESRLAELGDEVLTETNSLKGMEFVKHIRRDKKHANPVMVLSENTADTSLHKNLRIFLDFFSYLFKIYAVDVARKYKAIES